MDEEDSVEAVTLERQIKELTGQLQRVRRLNDNLSAGTARSAHQLETSASRLRESEQRLDMIIEAVTDYAIFMLDPDGNIVSWNSGARRIKGYERDEVVGTHFSRFYTEADRMAGMPARALQAAASAGKYEMEGLRVRKDGSVFWANIVLTTIRDPQGELIGFAKITRDLTERRANDERLRQAQKMEAIGQLTGGVAHDFNNLLMVVIGNLETAKRHLLERPDPILHRLIDAASHGANRGALLVHRLLAFSRSQPLEPRALTVNSLVSNMSDMLRRTLGEAIDIQTACENPSWPVFVDPTELESALLNLALNARDAMPDGGRLTIETANAVLEEPYARAAEVAPGEFVSILVSDTGAGMPPDIVAKAFDPFFTTKGPGRGTGLGLSQVYGFIRQSGGHVKIYSELGIGTTIKLYLPRHVAADTGVQVQADVADVPRGRGEVILVVEDDSDVRAYVTQMLRELGYLVYSASDGRSALQILDAHPEVVLLFTDIGLPGGMNGRQVGEQAVRRRPNIKVLFTSGYAQGAMVHHGRLDAGVELLSKPFTFASLATRIRRLLD